MRSYLEILNEIKETIDTDIIPSEDKEKINKAVENLFNLLWKYSD